MEFGSSLGQGTVRFLSCLRCGCRTGFEAEAVISGLEDVASVGQPIEQSCGHLGVAEDRGPFTEAEVGRDGDAGALVEFAQEVEEQGSPEALNGR